MKMFVLIRFNYDHLNLKLLRIGNSSINIVIMYKIKCNNLMIFNKQLRLLFIIIEI